MNNGKIKALNYLFEETFNSRVFNGLSAVFVPLLMFLAITINTWFGFVMFMCIVLGITYVYNRMHKKLNSNLINKVFRLIFGLQFFVFSIGIILSFVTSQDIDLSPLWEFVVIATVLLGLTYLPEGVNWLFKRENNVSYRIYFYVMLGFLIAAGTFYELQEFLKLDFEATFRFADYAYLMITIDVVIDLFKNKWNEKKKIKE